MEISALRLSFVFVVILIVATAVATHLSISENVIRWRNFPGNNIINYVRKHGRSNGGDGCCSVGLKTEWVVGANGKELKNICQAGSTCCQGLNEKEGTKPDGMVYSMCLP